MNDNGNILWDSHAICSYLIGKYAKDDLLYPKDLYTRAKVDQRLHFDSGILFPRIRNSTVHIFFKNQPEFSKEIIDAGYESYDFVEKFLQTDPYLVGKQLTVADLACITSITQTEIFAPIDSSKYPKLREWINRVAGHFDNFYDLNTKPLEELKAKFAQKIKENQEGDKKVTMQYN